MFQGVKKRITALATTAPQLCHQYNPHSNYAHSLRLSPTATTPTCKRLATIIQVPNTQDQESGTLGLARGDLFNTHSDMKWLGMTPRKFMTPSQTSTDRRPPQPEQHSQPTCTATTWPALSLACRRVGVNMQVESRLHSISVNRGITVSPGLNRTGHMIARGHAVLRVPVVCGRRRRSEIHRKHALRLEHCASPMLLKFAALAAHTHRNISPKVLLRLLTAFLLHVRVLQ